MPHVPLPKGVPGLLSLRLGYPRTARPLIALIEEALRGPSSLSLAEREVIATYVSSGNACTYCATLHAASARHLLAEEGGALDGVMAGNARLALDQLDTDPKLRALLVIAEMVRQDGHLVTEEDVARARAAGADDQAIHDTVLITSLFCMINRYVDGLGATTPEGAAFYERMGARLAAQGYAWPTHQRSPLRRVLRRLRRRKAV